MIKNISKLQKLKDNYVVFQKKYSLPAFDELNREFDIERVSRSETDFLLREIRKEVSKNFGELLRLIEAILNPVNAPMFLFAIIKTLKAEDKEKLLYIYQKMSKLELDSLRLTLDYSEKNEAEHIKKSLKLWQEIKKDFLEVVDIMDSKIEMKSEKGSKGYFG